MIMTRNPEWFNANILKWQIFRDMVASHSSLKVGGRRREERISLRCRQNNRICKPKTTQFKARLCFYTPTAIFCPAWHRNYPHFNSFSWCQLFCINILDSTVKLHSTPHLNRITRLKNKLQNIKVSQWNGRSTKNEKNRRGA